MWGAALTDCAEQRYLLCSTWFLHILNLCKGKRLKVKSFASPTWAELEFIPADLAWIERGKSMNMIIPESADLIVTTVRGILDSAKRGDAVTNFAIGKKITVIIEEASQVEQIFFPY